MGSLSFAHFLYVWGLVVFLIDALLCLLSFFFLFSERIKEEGET